MRELTLTRGISTAFCGVLLWAVACMPAAGASEDRTDLIKLVGGELRILNYYAVDRWPKVEINGQEFSFGAGSTYLEKRFRLSDRDIVIFATDLGGSGTRPLYDILSVGFRGAVARYETLYPPDDTFIAKQKGNTIYIDLGYDKGLKKDAVLSAKGLTVSMKPIARAAYDRKDCKWLYEQALEDCVARHSGTRVCTDLDLSMAAVRGLAAMENNPRWKIGGPRFEKLCAATCEGRKSPSYAEFAKDVCGP